MNSTELQEHVIRILRNLDVTDPIVRSFHAAFRFRQQHACTLETDSGSLGLRAALERAYLVYTPDEAWNGDVPAEGPDMFFALDLAVAAESIPPDAYERLMHRLERLSRQPAREDEVRQIIACALIAYVRRKDENLSPGP